MLPIKVQQSHLCRSLTIRFFLVYNLSVASTCEGIYGSCSTLLSSSSCCYSDGVLSPGVKVCQGGGGYIFRHCQLEQEEAVEHILHLIGFLYTLRPLHNRRSQPCRSL